MNSLSWIEISTRAIQHNIQQFRNILPPNYEIAAVIKSNAYGHGMIPMAQFLAKNKLVEYLATANDMEALTLRSNKIKIPILVLSYWNKCNLKDLAKNDIELGLYSRTQLQELKKIASNHRTIKIHLKIDTGMHRLGISPDEIIDYLTKIRKMPGVHLQGIFSHLPVADQDKKFTHQQIKKFFNIVAKAQKITKIPLVHIANSAGAYFMNTDLCNMIRLGIGLYGLSPSRLVMNFYKENNPRFNLQPGLTWKTKIIQVGKVKAGERISYGLTHKFKKPAQIAVLAIGYADGYDRKLSNSGEVLIKGKRCPVRGRVCMDLTMVEVTHVPDVREGDEVVLIGQQGKNKITADELAQKIGTINYEVVTRINPEIKRVYNQ